ncbi:ferredoxin [Sulfitobacter sp. LCG007]
MPERSESRTTEHARLDAEARERSLCILGGFHPETDDGLPQGTGTLLLLGPDEPRFWPVLQASREWRDGGPDPVDRWSSRVIGGWARELGAVALFPFGGPPFRPFIRWALRSGNLHASPIGLLVHSRAGLFVSIRGALALQTRIDLPQPESSPCARCVGRPCKSACPVDAFDGVAYDVAACKVYLETPFGSDCMERGCKARRACPVSQDFGRLPEQSAYHMKVFRG